MTSGVSTTTAATRNLIDDVRDRVRGFGAAAHEGGDE
jgi:hypothetical protein